MTDLLSTMTLQRLLAVGFCAITGMVLVRIAAKAEPEPKEGNGMEYGRSSGTLRNRGFGIGLLAASIVVTILYLLPVLEVSEVLHAGIASAAKTLIAVMVSILFANDAAVKKNTKGPAHTRHVLYSMAIGFCGGMLAIADWA